ncbi:MAG: ComF family protein [Verrucomicrobiota bacterium]
MNLPDRLRQGALGLIYPPSCASCEAPLPSKRQIEVPFLCEDCEDKLVPIPDGYCPVCGQSYDAPVSLTFQCGNCGDRTFGFEFAVSAYRSSGEAREMMHAHKYGRQLHLSRLFGHLMQRVWSDSRLQENSAWLIVPVPLHPRRLRGRGFNQAHEIAREFIRLSPEHIDMKLSPILKRTVHTVRQAQLDRKDRLTNLRGAFGLRKPLPDSAFEERGILIVDDVMTTGTTISECARVLRDHGADQSPIVGLSVLRG